MSDPAGVIIRDVDVSNIDDLCKICITQDKRDDPAFIRGMEEKRRWALEALSKWGSFAKLAYLGTDVAGLIQYEPIPAETVIRIHCIYVTDKAHWRRGIATRLLSSLIEEMRAPKSWFGDKPASALVTRTFPGEQPGQYPARLFFAKMGFRNIGEDPDLLYYPFKEDFTYQPVVRKELEYVPQEEDRGEALMIYGPSPCPFSYVFLKRSQQAIEEVAPGILIRWLNRADEPDQVERRGGIEGCVVNARIIKAFVFDKRAFQREVLKALRH